ncbi:thioredoxin family protein [Ferruginibacter sp. SUN106]|uniref:thioredoxin family protein n=1 Tax=Ferruginibacter sp. SUN106 TaxID=2978348 RepID=UPI003D369EC5
MKKIFFSLLAVVAFTAMAFTISNILPIGSVMPKADVKLKDISGKEVTIKEVKKENGVLVMFSCNTCPYVIKNQQRTVEVANYAEKNNVGIIILNSNEAQRNDDDSYEAMKAYAKEQGYKWHYAVDKNNELADAFGANRTPECFLFDKDLKLVYHGAIDDNPTDADNVKRHHLKEAINEMVAGKEVSYKESRSVGCGIKRKG